jgi:hypothetical protein
MMNIKESKQGVDPIVLIPFIGLLVAVGTLTDYNLIYTTIAGLIGWGIGRFLKTTFRRKKV